MHFLYQAIILTILSLNVFTFELNAQTAHFEFDFSNSNKGWQGDFADYNVGQEVFFELNWGWMTLPTASKDQDGKNFTQGIYLSGNNHSDDLFMFMRHRINGLQPNTDYDLTFHVIIESNVPPEQQGIGGSPGESVYFKVGASSKKPEKTEVNGFYQLNVEKGDQSQGGSNAIVIGDLANPLVDPSNPQFEPKSLSNEHIPLIVKSNDLGQLWLFVGTDSAFEGLTRYYIAHISVDAKPIESSAEIPFKGIKPKLKG